MTGILIRREMRHREKKDHMLIGAEMGVMKWEAKEPQLLATCRSHKEARKGSPLKPAEVGACLEFRLLIPRTLRKKNSAVSSHPVWGQLFQQPQASNELPL